MDDTINCNMRSGPLHLHCSGALALVAMLMLKGLKQPAIVKVVRLPQGRALSIKHNSLTVQPAGGQLQLAGDQSKSCTGRGASCHSACLLAVQHIFRTLSLLNRDTDTCHHCGYTASYKAGCYSLLLAAKLHACSPVPA